MMSQWGLMNGSIGTVGREGRGGGLAGELKVHMGVRGGGSMWGWGYRGEEHV